MVPFGVRAGLGFVAQLGQVVYIYRSRSAVFDRLVGEKKKEKEKVRTRQRPLAKSFRACERFCRFEVIDHVGELQQVPPVWCPLHRA